MKRVQKSLACCIGGIIGLAALPAYAQTTPAKSSVAALDEIVVTARRREEAVQTVPIAISAFSDEQLQQRNFRTTSELTEMTPGLHFQPSGGGNNPAIILRGQSRLPLGNSPGSAAVYFAEVPTQTEAQLVPTFDLANIQVLKGPQGTLFGRNTTAGAILISPKEPTYTREGYATISLGNYQSKTYEGAVTLPLIDNRLSLRLAGQTNEHQGYTDNIGGGPDFDDADNESFRAGLLWDITDNISNLTIVDSYHEDISGAAPLFVSVLNTGILRTPALASLVDCHTPNAFNPFPCTTFSPSRDIDDAYAQQNAHDRAAAYSMTPRQKRDIRGVMNRTTIDITDDLVLTNIFGYRSVEARSETDADSSPLRQIQENHQYAGNKQYTEELQLQGSAFDFLEYTVGGFYSKGEPNKAAGLRPDIFLRTGLWGSEYYDTKSKAVFGQGDFDLGSLVEGLSVTLGARYTWDKADLCALAIPGDLSGPPINASGCESYAGTPPALPPHSSVTSKSEATTWTASLNYQWTENVFVYLTSRRGYRQGGANAREFNTPGTSQNPPCPTVPGNACRDLRPYQTYDPEYVTDYELGIKTNWRLGDMDGRFNIDTFISKYEDIQTLGIISTVISPVDPGLPPFGAVFYNGGKVTVDGFDAEAALAVTSDLEFSANVSYFNGKLDEAAQFNVAGVAPGTSIVGVSPAWAYNVAVNYTLPFRPADTELAFNANYYWQDEFGPDEASTLDAYGTLNLRFDARGIAGSNFSVAAYVKNALDEQYFLGTANGASAFGFVSGFLGDPRTFGLEGTYRF